MPFINKNIKKALKEALERSEHQKLASVKYHRVKSPDFPNELVAIEKKLISSVYKFGVLYCKENQTTENEMFNNGRICFCSYLQLIQVKNSKNFWNSWASVLNYRVGQVTKGD